MKPNHRISSEIDLDQYVIFRTTDLKTTLNENSQPYVVVDRKNGDYDILMKKFQLFGKFESAPEEEVIPCRFLRYKAIDNEYILDDYCQDSSIQILKLQTTTSGW